MPVAVLFYKWLTICFCSLLTVSRDDHAALPPHPFYVSVTEMNHNAADKTLEISCKLFADDLEQILEKNYGKSLDIIAGENQAEFNKLIPDYIGKNLVLAIDGKPVKLSYVGYEVEKESAYCYFQVSGLASLKKIDISNGILYDFVESEINIMHVTVNGKRKSTRLDYPDKNASFSF